MGREPHESSLLIWLLRQTPIHSYHACVRCANGFLVNMRERDAKSVRITRRAAAWRLIYARNCVALLMLNKKHGPSFQPLRNKKHRTVGKGQGLHRDRHLRSSSLFGGAWWNRFTGVLRPSEVQ